MNAKKTCMNLDLIRPHKLNSSPLFPFSMRASGHYSLFSVHFLYHCEPRPSLKGRGLPLTGNAKVKGHACSLHSVEDSESKASFLLVSVSLEGKQTLWTCCAYNYVEHLKVLCSVHVINNE